MAQPARVTVSTTELQTFTLGVGVLQAYRILYWGFVALPIIAGVDKFFHQLCNWDMYLSPTIARLLPVSAHNFMLFVGVIEIAAGLCVWLAPRLGSLLVAFHLWGIIINLLLGPGFYDIALRDFGLMLGALALFRMSGGVLGNFPGSGLRNPPVDPDSFPEEGLERTA